MGVTKKELDNARAYASRLKAEQEQSVERLNAQISQKADTQQLSALKEEATTKFGAVNKDVTAVRTDVETTRKELEGTRRDLVDVKDTLTQQIARNRDELQQLRLKGERNFYEFELDKKKKVALVGMCEFCCSTPTPKRRAMAFGLSWTTINLKRRIAQ